VYVKFVKKPDASHDVHVPLARGAFVSSGTAKAPNMFQNDTTMSTRHIGIMIRSASRLLLPLRRIMNRMRDDPITLNDPDIIGSANIIVR
jgi:hypothetical protein